MLTAALHLTPILAEKSRTAFFIVGGILVAWALILSLGVGLRRPSFPGDERGQRAVMAITAILVLGTLASAVLTSSSPAKAGASPPASRGAPLPGAPAETTTTPSSTTPAPASTAAPSSTTAAAPASAAASTANLSASPAGLLSFDTKTLSAKAGTVAIVFTNTAPIEHNVTIASGTTVLGATPSFTGGSRTLTLKLKPGTYTFYCSVPGHRAAGMEGTLHVS